MAFSDSVTDAIAGLARQIPAEREDEGVMRRLVRKAILGPVNRLVHLAIPFAGRSGFEIEALQPGYLRARMPFKGNRNHIGTMYAGALFTLAEIPGGVIVIFDMGAAFIPILKSLEMTYLKTARTDVTVEFHFPPEQRDAVMSEVRQQGKAEFVLKADLTDERGEVVAKSHALYQVRQRA